MGMLNSVTAMIDRYGNSVTVKNGGINVKTRAFVEPLRYKNKIYIGGRYHPLGGYDNEKYLYIGKPSIALGEEATVVECAGESYVVKRAELYRVSDTPVYARAILARSNGRMEDEYDSDKSTFGYDY